MTEWMWPCARSFPCASDFGIPSSFKIRHSSFTPERLPRINFGGAPRRQVAGGESHGPEKQTDQTERQRVGRSDSEKQARQETSEGQRARQTEYDPTAHQECPVSQDQTKHVPTSGA